MSTHTRWEQGSVQWCNLLYKTEKGLHWVEKYFSDFLFKQTAYTPSITGGHFVKRICTRPLRVLKHSFISNIRRFEYTRKIQKHFTQYQVFFSFSTFAQILQNTFFRAVLYNIFEIQWCHLSLTVLSVKVYRVCLQQMVLKTENRLIPTTASQQTHCFLILGTKENYIKTKKMLES